MKIFFCEEDETGGLGIKADVQKDVGSSPIADITEKYVQFIH